MNESVEGTAVGCLHVFDMDGTLLRSTATIELARQMGQPKAGQEIERLWREEAISDTDFWLNLLEICKDATPVDFDEAFQNSPWMEGVAETFEGIRSRGEDVIVISQSPAFFVRRLEAWGANETYGSAVELGSRLESTATLMPEAKVEIAQSAIAARDLSADECVVYGDSSSDVELFTTFPHSVAVNPTPVLAPLAAKTYQGVDIREAHALGRELIATAAGNKFVRGSSN